MSRQRYGMIPFWTGLVLALAFASIATWSLLGVLRTHSAAEVADSVWNTDGSLFRIWALAVPFGSLLAVIGALRHVKADRRLAWLLGAGFPVIVIAMVIIFTREYYPAFFGFGGVLILVTFFTLVRVWMKKHAGLDQRRITAGSLKLIGYLFWITATWFLCGETAKLHLKAYAGSSPPSPIEIMVFLVLGWLFVSLGEYRAWKIQQL